MIITDKNNNKKKIDTLLHGKKIQNRLMPCSQAEDIIVVASIDSVSILFFTWAVLSTGVLLSHISFFIFFIKPVEKEKEGFFKGEFVHESNDSCGRSLFSQVTTHVY